MEVAAKRNGRKWGESNLAGGRTRDGKFKAVSNSHQKSKDNYQKFNLQFVVYAMRSI